jgi:hypothetical protein
MKKLSLLLLTSTLLLVLTTINGFGQCTPGYTSPSYACSYGYAIASFSMPGVSSTAINDRSGCTSTGYSNRTSRDSCSVQQGGTYTATPTSGGSSYRYMPFNVQAWIDFNRNNTFESSETVGGANTIYTSGSFSVAIPVTAPVGRYRMRIITVFGYSGIDTYPTIDPCATSYTYGEGRDYTVNVTAAPACSGTPTAGRATCSDTTACGSTPVTLSLSGSTARSGISYQWQSSSDGSTWTDISGATTFPYTTSVSSRTWFRCVLTCGSSSSATSTSIRVNYSSICYCIPTFLYASMACSSYGMSFSRFAIRGHSGSTLTDAAGCDGTGYLDRSSLSVDLQQARTYNCTLDVGSSSYSMSVQAFIDINNNGTFESSETVGGTSYFTTSSTFGITVPFSTSVGSHRLRVVTVYSAYGTVYPSIASCPTGSYPYYYGEVRDYTINVVALPSCTGSPSAGTVFSSTRIACPSRSFTLTDTGFTIADSIRLQWQFSTDSVTWSNVSGGTSSVFSTTITSARYFRMRIACLTSGDTAISSPIFVGYIPYCYCIPSYSSGAMACTSYGMNIASYDVTGHSGSTLADRASCDGTGYIDRTTLSVNLQQSGTYRTTITSSSSTYMLNVQNWIDFSDNGTFETSEIVGGLNRYTGSGNYNISIPIAARTGSHRMRVMVSYYSYGSYPTMDPCSSSYIYGETRDYMVNVVALPPCSGTPTAGGLTTDRFVVCARERFILNDTGFTVAGSLGFQWQRSTDSVTWSNISGATDYYYSDTIAVTTYFRSIVTCTVSGASDTTAFIRIERIPFCYCAPSILYASMSCSSYGMDIATLGINGYSGSTLRDAADCDGSGYLNRTGLSVDMMQSLTYTTSVTASGTYSLHIQAWIDFNDNGRFDTITETVGGRNTYSRSTTFGITIPIAATPGRHRMRVRVTYASGSDPSYPSMSPCGSTSYGEVRDYTVNVIALPPCSGTPTGGVAYASVGRSCPSRSFFLYDTGFSVAGSLSFLWERSSDSVTWTSISGATSPVAMITATGPSYYRCLVTCTISGSSAYSVPTYVLFDSACYCMPSFMYASMSCSSYGMDIDQFVVLGESGTNINDRASCDGTGYIDRTTLSVSLMQSLTYDVTIASSGTSSSYYYPMNAQVWIDFNNNGIFATSESVGGINGYTGTGNFTITLPLTARTGSKRMRVLTTYASSGYSYPSLDPCASSYSYGEVRDYVANVVPLPPCSGTPNAGRATSTAMVVCSSTSFTLSPIGYTPASGLTFQWQRSTDSVSWSYIAGATGFTYTTTTSTDIYYRVRFICASSGDSAFSSAVFINRVSGCYCVPSYTYASSACTYGYSISRFGVNGHVSSAIDDRASCDGSGYLNRTSLSCDMMQSFGYLFTLYCSRASSSVSMNCQAWVDWNDNGTFETSEVVAGMNGYSSGSPAIDTIAIPMSAPVGPHVLRVVTSYGSSYSYYGYGSYPSMTPCPTSYYYGEARDYVINVLALPPCSGTPSAGNATASVATACPSTPFTLNARGYTYASGMTYQWQISADSITWTNISGATTIVYNATHSSPRYYRIVFTCTASGASAYSVPVYVGYISYCYCRPSYSMASSACGTYGLYITRLRIPGYGSTLNDSNACDGSGYQILTTYVVNFLQGGSYTASIASGSTTNGLSVQMWIDYNNNGTFERSEQFGGISTFRGSTTFSCSVPTTAALGYHRMRIVTSWDASGYSYPGLDPCASGYVMGDARDYTANIVLPGCTGTPNGGSVIASSASGCTSFSTILGLDTFASTGSGIEYVWQSSSDSVSWSTLGGATSSTYTASLTSSTYYRAILTCMATSYSDTANALRVTVLPSPSAITGASYVCSGSSITLSSATSGGRWSASPASIATISASGVLYGVATGTAVVTYTGSNGCPVTATVIVNPSPASITGSMSACVGGTTTLSSATGGGTWTSASSSVASVDPSTGVVYGVSAGTVVISYTLPTGCSGPSPTTTTTVTVNPLPAAITGTTAVCLGTTGTVSSATSGGTWSSSSTSTVSVVATTGRITGVTVGSATITYTSVSTGCRTTAAVTVNSLTVPTLSMASTPGTAVCAGTSVTFAANTTNAGSAPTYVWSVNGTILSGATSYTYAPANGDVVRIWFRSSVNCASPDSMSRMVTMAVTPRATPAITTTTGLGDTVCAGTSVTIRAVTVDGGSSPAYRWWINGTAVSGSASYTYTPSHGDVITTRLISNAACRTVDSATTTKIVTVSAPVTPSVTLNAISGTNICSGNYANFTASSVFGGSAPAYNWFVNGVASGSGASFSYLPSNGDVVTVTMVSSFPCTTDSFDLDSVVLAVIPVVSPVATVAVSPGYIVTAGTTVTFTCSIVSGGGSTPSYQWTRNSSSIAGATSSTYTTSAIGSGDVFTCIVTNNDPCSGVSAMASGITMTIGNNTGVNNVSNSTPELLIVPNPNNGSFVVKGTLGASADEDVVIEITDMLGQVVYRENVSAVKGQLNESVKLSGSLANGMYLVNIKSKNVNQVFHFVLAQ